MPPCVGDRDDGRYAKVTPLEQIKTDRAGIGDCQPDT